MKSYRKLYEKIFKKIDLEKVLRSYKLNFKYYNGQNGREYLMRCPFPDHDDLSPSFCINRKSGVWHCFVCGAGDFIKFVKIMESLSSTREAINFVKKQIGFNDNFQVSFETLDKSFEEMKCIKKIEKNEKLPSKLETIKLPNCVSADQYFSIVKKRVSLKIIKDWDIQYCANPRNKYEEKWKGRLIIPIYFDNKLVSFVGRDMTGRSKKWEEIKKQIKKENLSDEEINELTEKYEYKKYLYPFAAPLLYIFFNWNNAIKNSKYVIIVEGIFDAIKLVEYGYNVIAILSCHLNNYRVNLLLECFDVIYIALDNDDKINQKGLKVNPGQEAAQKLIEKFDETEVYNIVLPKGKDPDDCTKYEFGSCFRKSRKIFEKKSFTFN